MAEKDNDIEVTRDDQMMINSFGRLTLELKELEAELKDETENYKNLEDAEAELMLSVGDEPVRFLVGEVYMGLNSTDAEQMLEQNKTKVQGAMDKLSARIEDIKKTLAELKVKLYHKFGSNINLEE
jgi:prefoldin subunit 4